MKKKIWFSFLAALFLLFTVFVINFLMISAQSKYGKTISGKKVIFDSEASKILASQDKEMSKKGYKVKHKIIDSREESGFTELLPYNGVNMAMQKVISVYILPQEVTSHSKTFYQRFLSKLEGYLGRLPEVFYVFDIAQYDGDVETTHVTSKITNIFLLIDDSSKKRIGSKYFTYAGACQLKDDIVTTYTYFENGVKETKVSSTVNTYSSPHFEGDLSWLKSMAYTNYVSPYTISEAFETFVKK